MPPGSSPEGWEGPCGPRSSLAALALDGCPTQPSLRTRSSPCRVELRATVSGRASPVHRAWLPRRRQAQVPSPPCWGGSFGWCVVSRHAVEGGVGASCPHGSCGLTMGLTRQEPPGKVECRWRQLGSPEQEKWPALRGSWCVWGSWIRRKRAPADAGEPVQSSRAPGHHPGRKTVGI